MPSSLSYDHSSLVLGTIVDPRVVDLLKQINNLQSKTDASQEKMNSLVMMKRSLAMTLNELVDMGIDPSAIRDKLADLDQKITQSANDYITIKLANEDEVSQLRTSLYSLENSDGLVTPVDFTLSEVKFLPLSADSVKIDLQYFSFESDQQNDTIAGIEKYVKDATADLGQKSNTITNAVSAQVNRQLQNHSLSGTLIITATCTHKNVCTINPFVIDVDNCVSIWNDTFSGPGDHIDIGKATLPLPTPAVGKNDDAKQLSVVSGASYGSSFVGMIHFLKKDTAENDVDAETLQKLSDKLRMGGWLENASGGMGVESSVMDDVKMLLSTQTFSTHMSLVVMGALPSIAAGEVKMGVNRIIQSDANKNKALISSLSQLADTDINTVETGANEAKTANRMVKLQQADTTALLNGLSKIDQQTNKVIDINSLMAAFENYIETVKNSTGMVGVPVNFFFKSISRQQIINKLIEKYQTGSQPDAVVTK